MSKRINTLRKKHIKPKKPPKPKKPNYSEYMLSDKWQKKRLARMKMDNNTCQMCGAKKRLSVHHLTYERFGREDVEHDLITLCLKCHQKVDLEKRKESAGE